MKKHNKTIALAACALVMSSSCLKDGGFTSVRFSVGVPSGEITRAMPDGLSDALSATAPTGPFTLTAQSTENSLRSYSVTTETDVTMAIGGYSVTGNGTGGLLSKISSGNLYSSPSWSVSQDVTVTESSTEFSLPASYTCPAFVFDLSEVDYVEFSNGADMFTLTLFPGTERYGVVYPKPDQFWISSKPLWMYVYPKDKVNGETALYKVITPSTGADAELTQVRNGYWYKFSPGKVDVVSGALGLAFPEWMEGE